MKEKDYLAKALELAGYSSEPVGCGVVLVKAGEVIAEAFNSQRADNQAVNHAEIKAIRTANSKLDSRTLDGAVAYCSCEPCVMCLVALSLAKVDEVVYGYTMKQLFPDDPMADIDAEAFVKQLSFVPKLRCVMVS